MKKYLISALSLLLCLSLQPDLFAAKKKLSMSEADDEGNNDICAQNIAFCLQLDAKDTVEVTLNFSNPTANKPTFKIGKQSGTIWQSSPSDVSLVSHPNVNTYVYEVVVDLNGILGPKGRAGFSASIALPTNVLLAPGGGGKLNGNASSNTLVFFSRAICLREYCTRFDQCPCEGDGGSLGGFKVGIIGGQQNPGFATDDLTRTDFAFNVSNKFVGLQIHSTRRPLYYQAELAISQLNFRTNLQGNSTGRRDATFSLTQLQLVPVQLRLRLGRLASVGSGLGLSYQLRGTENDQPFPEPNRPLDKLEPEWFADIRLGNALKGIQVGYRYGIRWNQLADLMGEPYRVGKMYLAYAF